MLCVQTAGLGLALGQLRYLTGGPGGLPPGLGFGLGRFRYRTGGLMGAVKYNFSLYKKNFLFI